MTPGRTRRAMDWLLWQMLLDWSPEKLSGFCAFTWGLWVFTFRFLENGPGWHFLVWLVRWQPFVSPDEIWGAVGMVLGLRQLQLACQTFELSHARVQTTFLSGCVWAFFAVAILLSQPASTGVVVYAWLAWNSFAAYYQLSLREQGRRTIR